MPYAFAHPAAVIPLHRLLGRFSVPSALAIGSVIPDAWYLVPHMTRIDSHVASGLLLFGLPAGLFVYVAFHLVFKMPLLSLFPRRLAARLRPWAAPGLPAVSWLAVLLSLAAGTATHLAWDAFTHEGILSRSFPLLQSPIFDLAGYEVPLHQVLQHASTLLGTAAVAWWIWLKLRTTARLDATEPVPPAARATIVALLVMVPAAVFLSVVLAASPSPAAGIEDARRLVRAAGVTALSTLGMLLVSYCIAWRFYSQRRTRFR